MDYTDLLGTKFKIHGRSKKEGFDCYGLAIEVLKRNGVELPDIIYQSLDERNIIHDELHSLIPNVRIANPEINCIIELCVHGEPLHVGVYLGNGLFIHSTKDIGVIIEPIKRYSKRIKGYYKVCSN